LAVAVVAAAEADAVVVVEVEVVVDEAAEVVAVAVAVVATAVAVWRDGCRDNLVVGILAGEQETDLKGALVVRDGRTAVGTQRGHGVDHFAERAAHGLKSRKELAILLMQFRI
jgi:hypothetical protein